MRLPTITCEKAEETNENTFLILGIVFLLLTFAGGGYVFANHGQVSAGYAVIPGIWAIVCLGVYRGKGR